MNKDISSPSGIDINKELYYKDSALSESVLSWLDGLPSSLTVKVSKMINNGNGKGAIQELKNRLSVLREQAHALEVSIGILEQPTESIMTTPDDAEFISLGMSDAVEILIKRARKPLHVSQIVKGLKGGGFRFRTKQPKKTVPGALHGAIKNNKTRIVFKGKNTFSLPEINSSR